MRKSLNLVGDGDESDLIKDLEDIFAIKFAVAELAACRTAGDLNGILWRHLSRRAGSDNVRCMDAIAFYALRSVLVSAGARPENQAPGSLGQLFHNAKKPEIGTVEAERTCGAICFQRAGDSWPMGSAGGIPGGAAGLEMARLTDIGRCSWCCWLASHDARPGFLQRLRNRGRCRRENIEAKLRQAG